MTNEPKVMPVDGYFLMRRQMAVRLRNIKSGIFNATQGIGSRAFEASANRWLKKSRKLSFAGKTSSGKNNYIVKL
jgi:hypothetical protein